MSAASSRMEALREEEKERRQRTESGLLGDPRSPGGRRRGRGGPALGCPLGGPCCRARGTGRGRRRALGGARAKLGGARPEAGPGRAGRAGGGQRGGGAGAARGGVSAAAAGAATAPGSGSGGLAMWLLGPLCLLLSSAAGESEGVGRTSCGARGAGRGRGGRAAMARPPRAGAASPGGRARRAAPGAGLAGTRARGRGGVRAVLLCGRAGRLVPSAVCAGGALCAARLRGARLLPRLGVAPVCVCACASVLCVLGKGGGDGRGGERTLP